MPDLFISYAREDQARIKPLVQLLQGHGWEVFWDRTVPAGETWRSWLESNIRSARCVVVAWSEHSVRSRWVQEEAETGLRRGALLPVRLDDVDPPFGFSTLQAADLLTWDGAPDAGQAKALITALERKLGEAAEMVPQALPAEVQGSKTAANRNVSSGRIEFLERAVHAQLSAQRFHLLLAGAAVALGAVALVVGNLLPDVLVPAEARWLSILAGAFLISLAAFPIRQFFDRRVKIAALRFLEQSYHRIRGQSGDAISQEAARLDERFWKLMDASLGQHTT